jgi:hypothetical protein
MAEDKPFCCGHSLDKRMWRGSFSLARRSQILNSSKSMSSTFPFDFSFNAGQNSDFNPAQSSNFNAGSSLAAPPVQVEALSLAEVMKNPIVQRMYNTLQEATDKVMQGVQIQQSLYQENSRLNAEVKELQKIRQDSM